MAGKTAAKTAKKTTEKTGKKTAGRTTEQAKTDKLEKVFISEADQ